MKRWMTIAEAQIPGTDASIRLLQGKDDFCIKLSSGDELMNTRTHGSEDALGTIPCSRLRQRAEPRILIGGMGMGFTLAAALASVGDDAEVTVAELIPEVVEWNRGPLGESSGYPLADPRVRVEICDVARLLRRSPNYFDVIALDVDNGPEGLTSRKNDWLYSLEGVARTQASLRPNGVLAYWSAGPDRDFADCLRHAGLRVEEIKVHAHGSKGTRHTIWLAS